MNMPIYSDNLLEVSKYMFISTNKSLMMNGISKENKA